MEQASDPAASAGALPVSKLVAEHFKSLERFTLDLGPLTVLIGPNAAGKSNILSCLSFLSDLVSRASGNVYVPMEPLVFDGDQTRAMAFEVHGTLPEGTEGLPYRYRIELTSDPHHGWCCLQSEVFEAFVGGVPRRLLHYPAEGTMAKAFDLQGAQRGGIGAGDKGSYLGHFTDRRVYPQLVAFADLLRRVRPVHLVPAALRGPKSVSRVQALEPSGANLAAALHALHVESPARYARCLETLGLAFPGLTEVRPALTGESPARVELRVKESALTRALADGSVSDGFLRMLALLLALELAEPPALLCFEEPEDGVHPRLLEWLAAAFREASGRVQVLVTTHSPYLVDRLEPEEVVVVEKEQGRTSAHRLGDRPSLRERLKHLGLGELWYEGSFDGAQA